MNEHDPWLAHQLLMMTTLAWDPARKETIEGILARWMSNDRTRIGLLERATHPADPETLEEIEQLLKRKES